MQEALTDWPSVINAVVLVTFRSVRSRRRSGAVPLSSPSESRSLQKCWSTRGRQGNRTLNLRIKSLNCAPSLTCGFLFRMVPAVHGHFWGARGFFVGSDVPPGGVSGWVSCRIAAVGICSATSRPSSNDRLPAKRALRPRIDPATPPSVAPRSLPRPSRIRVSRGAPGDEGAPQGARRLLRERAFLGCPFRQRLAPPDNRRLRCLPWPGDAFPTKRSP